MKKFVNSLSIFRILAAFAIIPLFLFQMHWIVFSLFVLAAVSDFFDGYLAKKYKVTSKIGGVLDHIGDKLLIVTSMIILAVIMRVWFIMVPIILMIAREIYVSGLREFLGTQKIEMPVTKERFSIAKIKTTLQMIAVGVFFLVITISSSNIANQPDFCIFGVCLMDKNVATILELLDYLLKGGIGMLWLSLIASLWSATTYTLDFKKKAKNLK